MHSPLRPAHPDEAVKLSALCLRSKGFWGYDQGFLNACRDELTLSPKDISEHPTRVAEVGGHVAGLAQVGRAGADADLLLLYVDLPFMGRGLGRALFDWSVDQANAMRAPRLLIESDPHAAPFYQRMGATQIGKAASGSIPGRFLPHLALTLK